MEAEMKRGRGGFLTSLFVAGVVVMLMGVMAGVARFLILSFIVGIQGMVVGGFSGAFTGALLRGKGSSEFSFPFRLFIAVMLGFLYFFGQLIGAGMALPVFDPFFLLESLMNDDFREVVTGISNAVELRNLALVEQVSNSEIFIRFVRSNNDLACLSGK